MKIKLETLPPEGWAERRDPIFGDMREYTLTYDEFIERFGFDAMPKGPWFEDDGGSWRIIEAENAALEGHKWRWQPLNDKALGKEGPTGRLREPPAKFSEY